MKMILQDLRTIALATMIAATPLLGIATFATVEALDSSPASAQNYGNGYGYNNGIKNGYGASLASHSFKPKSMIDCIKSNRYLPCLEPHDARSKILLKYN